MRLSIFFGILLALLGIALTSAVAPLIGLGQGEDFLLYQLVGVHRVPLLKNVMMLTFLLCAYQVLSIGLVAKPTLPKWRAVLQAALIDVTTTFAQLSGQPTARIRNTQWQQIAILYALFAVTFVFLRFPTIFLSKYRNDFEFSTDQIWHQTFVDYDADWRTPLFSFAGNVLNNFGIQLPLNTQLLPVLGLSQLFAYDQHIPTAVVLFFITMSLLFWVIGAAWGVPPVSRALFAALVALITNVPEIDLIFWLLPHNFFTSQFVYALWWQEATILFLVTVLFFYWIGQGKTVVMNTLYGVGFTWGCLLAVLGYPVGGIYFVPLIGLYCLVFLCTSVGRAEWTWKGLVSAVVAVVMLAAKVPQFFANLYLYSFGSYFVDLIRTSIFVSFYTTFMVNREAVDSRPLVVYIVSMVTVAIVVFWGTGALRRFAIAILVCEATIIAIGSVNALIFRVPMFLAYAEIAHSPLWGAYFVLLCMAVAIVIDRRLTTLPAFVSGRVAAPLRYAIKHRYAIYVSALVAVLFAIAILVPPQQGRPYPPAQPPIVQLLEREVAVKPGAPFRGRLLISMQDYEQLFSMLQYNGKKFGNDLYIDLLPFGIPMVNEWMHWTSPLTFAFLRAFFGRDRDGFNKAFFMLTDYDAKIARLMGVRVVVTNVKLFDGVLLHERKADPELRVYRLEDVNLGQFSPTQPVRISTAAEAVTAMKAKSFDPHYNVVVEGEIPVDLVPAGPVSVTMEPGPQLHIRASSQGHSLLVLPFEFSHCLRLHAPAGNSAYLLPVNLQQTGLIFEGQIAVSIEYRYGLFDDAQCRGADLDRANALHLHELVSAPNR